MWSVLLSTTSTRHYSFPKHFFLLFLHVERAKVFERKVWRVQVAHLHNAARALSSPSCQQILTEISFVIFDIVVKNKSNVVQRGLYSYRQRVRVITAVKICCGLTRLRLVSPQHFDHRDDAYSLSIRVQATLNHIRFVKRRLERALRCTRARNLHTP